MAELSDLLQEVIASALTDYSEVEVVRLSYSTWPAPIYLTYQLEDYTEITDSTGTHQVRNVPMKLSDESQDGLVSNTRSLTIQGINDLIAYYEDLTGDNPKERIKCEVLLYLIDRKNVVSSVQARFPYFVLGIDASQKSNSSTLQIATSPTNNSETGIKFTSSRFPSLKGFE